MPIRLFVQATESSEGGRINYGSARSNLVRSSSEFCELLPNVEFSSHQKGGINNPLEAKKGNQKWQQLTSLCFATFPDFSCYWKLKNSIYPVLLQNMFLAIYAVFTGKLSKNCACWEKWQISGMGWRSQNLIKVWGVNDWTKESKALKTFNTICCKKALLHLFIA